MEGRKERSEEVTRSVIKEIKTRMETLSNLSHSFSLRSFGFSLRAAGKEGTSAFDTPDRL